MLVVHAQAVRQADSRYRDQRTNLRVRAGITDNWLCALTAHKAPTNAEASSTPITPKSTNIEIITVWVPDSPPDNTLNRS